MPMGRVSRAVHGVTIFFRAHPTLRGEIASQAVLSTSTYERSTQEQSLSASFALQVVRSMHQEACERAERMPCPKKYGDPLNDNDTTMCHHPHSGFVSRFHWCPLASGTTWLSEVGDSFSRTSLTGILPRMALE